MIGHRRILTVGLILGLAVAIILLSVPAIARADDIDASKLVGTWVLTKVGGKEAPLPLELGFSKDGKATHPLGKEIKDVKGTYKLDGDKLTITYTIRIPATGKGKKPTTRTTTTTSTIVTLTDDVLVTKAGNLESEYTKKK